MLFMDHTPEGVISYYSYSGVPGGTTFLDKLCGRLGMWFSQQSVCLACRRPCVWPLKLDTVVHSCNPSILEVGTGWSGDIWGSPGTHGISQSKVSAWGQREIECGNKTALKLTYIHSYCKNKKKKWLKSLTLKWKAWKIVFEICVQATPRESITVLRSRKTNHRKTAKVPSAAEL